MISGLVSQGHPVFQMPYKNWSIHPLQMLGSGVILVSGASGVVSGIPTYCTNLQVFNNSGTLYFGESGRVISGTSPCILSGQNATFTIDTPAKLHLVGSSGLPLNVMLFDY